MWRFIKVMMWAGIFAALNGFFFLTISASIIYQRLPVLDALEDYRPRLPMRIYSSEGALLAEFGEEKRIFRRYADFPDMLIKALLATEDARFFQHQGLDYIGVMRAALGYFEGRREGASTITMQVARNFYLTRERTFLRKGAEALLALKIEKRFGKRAILERYMNQIYLGRGVFGYGEAARIYFNKELNELTTSEIALLAGLPQAPSKYDPRHNPAQAKIRQNHVLRRMVSSKIISQEEYRKLRKAALPVLHNPTSLYEVEAAFVADMVRQLAYEHFGEAAYERGLKIYTTIQKHLQEAAVDAVRRGLVAHQQRRPFAGPEKLIDIRGMSKDDMRSAIAAEPTYGGLRPALITGASQKALQLIDGDGQEYNIKGEPLAQLQARISEESTALVVGGVVRLFGAGEQAQVVTLPGAEAALVALSPEDGAVLALVGGFDFKRSQFNHATQARRQPGSSIKPFMYSAALEKGFTPASTLIDAPIFLSEEETGSDESWEPKNYDGVASGEILFRDSLARSKNLASVRLLEFIGVRYFRDYLARFGFRTRDHPPYLTTGLGAGVATLMEVASGYAVFANGGFRVNDYLITRVEDYDGNVIINELDFESRRRAIDARNAFIMTSLLQSAIREGTGRSVLRYLDRNDLAGKTGTTNDTIDAWFAGYGGNIVSAVWIGYDQLRSLGEKETGARAALPIWGDFMRVGLQGTLPVEYLLPNGVIAADINRDTGKLLSAVDAEKGRTEYFYQELLPVINSSSNDALDETEDLL